MYTHETKRIKGIGPFKGKSNKGWVYWWTFIAFDKVMTASTLAKAMEIITFQAVKEKIACGIEPSYFKARLFQ